MGKLDAKYLSSLNYEELKTLETVEFEMKNHQLVPKEVIAAKVNIGYGGVHKILQDLCRSKLMAYERGRKSEGYRLTNQGFDFIALKHLVRKKAVTHFGDQVGVGKESNIYSVANEDRDLDIEICLKLHRLGRTCFRNIKNKRDYIPNNAKHKSTNWLMLSKASAAKEYNYMKALHNGGFPVPEPIAIDRHCVVMEFIVGTPLKFVRELNKKTVSELYEELMDIIVKFAVHGCIHGDFNEFNIILKEESEDPVIIDFPQMVSTNHSNAKMLFTRDVNCIKKFFLKRFNYESEIFPKWKNVQQMPKEEELDKAIYCPGFNRKVERELDKYIGVDSESFGEQQDSDGEDLDNSDYEGEYNCFEEEQGESSEETSSDDETHCETLEEICDNNLENSCNKECNEKLKLKERSCEQYNDNISKLSSLKQTNLESDSSKEINSEIKHLEKGVSSDIQLNDIKNDDKLNELAQALETIQVKEGSDKEEQFETCSSGSSENDQLYDDIDRLGSASVGQAASLKNYKSREDRIADARQRARVELKKQSRREAQKRASKNAKAAVAYKGRKDNHQTVKEYNDFSIW